MDGTLVDTEPYWIAAEHEIVEEHGGVWSEEYAHELVGNDLMVSAELIRAHSPVTLTPVEIVEELLRRVIVQVREHVPWRPGARELLAALGSEGVPCVLVTMSWRSLADAVVARVQDEGTCWLGGTRWQGRAAMRISVSGWRTTADDADRSAAAIAGAWRAVA